MHGLWNVAVAWPKFSAVAVVGFYVMPILHHFNTSHILVHSSPYGPVFNSFGLVSLLSGRKLTSDLR